MKLETKLAIAKRPRLWRFIVGLDQALNPLVFDGSEDVTLSAQAAYRELFEGKSAKPRKIIDWVFRTFFKEQNHCFLNLIDEAEEFGVYSMEVIKRCREKL